jgi:hypothetical protein
VISDEKSLHALEKIGSATIEGADGVQLPNKMMGLLAPHKTECIGGVCTCGKRKGPRRK